MGRGEVRLLLAVNYATVRQGERADHRHDRNVSMQPGDAMPLLLSYAGAC